MCGAGLACFRQVLCPRPGSGRGATLGGCPLGCLGVCFAGLFVVVRGAAGLCARVVWGVAFRGGMVAWLGLCVRGLAWAGPGASGGGTVRFFMRIKIPMQRLPFPIFIY